MNDLISKNTVSNTIESLCYKDCHRIATPEICEFCLMTKLQEAIDKTPAEDAVKVIRCKDCKYRYVEFGQNFCKELDDMFYKYDDHEPIDLFGFCEKGERGEDK